MNICDWSDTWLCGEQVLYAYIADVYFIQEIQAFLAHCEMSNTSASEKFTAEKMGTQMKRDWAIALIDLAQEI